MSSDALPISPARFASALKDLPLTTLHLKVLELRNSIAHLDYSNEQLRPFALGLETPLGSSAPSQPDPDCVDAIRENEEVIERMQERINLLRAEVEGRGVSWTEFQSKEEADARTTAARTNGVNGHAEEGENSEAAEERHPAWSDGTFTMGTIRNGELHMDDAPRPAAGSTTAAAGGGSLTDEQLRRMLEEQLGPLGDDDENEEGGLHL